MESRVKVRIVPFNDREHLQLQWTDPTTGRRKTRSSGTGDRREVERRRADLEYELNHGLHAEPSRMTWEAFRQLFEAEHVAGLRPNTRGNMREALDQFEAHAPVRLLRSVDERHVSAYATRLRDLGRKPQTVLGRLTVLRTALRWAHRQKLIPSVPEFPRVRVPRRRPQAVPAEAFERLLDVAEGEMRAFLLAGWLAGLRINEAMALEWSPTDRAPWVDLERNRILFPAAASKNHSDEWIPLDPTLRSALEELPRHGPRVFALESRAGGRMTRTGMSERVRKLARRAGVRLSFHGTRRGFLSHYAARVPAAVLQRLARHADIRTTVAFYANTDAAMEAAVLGCNKVATSSAETAENLGS